MTNMFDRVVGRHKREHVLDGVDNKEHVLYDGDIPDSEQVMPTATATKTTASLPVAGFQRFAKLGRSNATIQGRIALLLAKLAQATQPETVKGLCEDEKAWFLEHYTSSSSRTTYMSAYRKAIKACFDELGIQPGLETERETVKGLVTQHIAMNYMMAPAEDYQTKQKQNKAKTAEQRDNLTPFDAEAAINATETALTSVDLRVLASGLIMSVQSRPSDMLKAGEFKAVSRYQIEFTSKAKKRGSSVKGEVWTLVDSATFIDAFNRLRRDPNVLELKAQALKDIDSQKNSTINRAIQRVYGDIIKPPYGEKELSAKNLRAAGVYVGYYLYGKETQSLGRFAELQLLHDNPGTAANYEDYYCVNAEGQRVSDIGIRKDSALTQKPRSRSTTRPTLDYQIVDELHSLFPEGEYTKDCIISAIAEVKRLRKELATAQKRLEKIGSEPPSENTQKPSKQDDDISTLSNAELLGSRKRGAADEKLKRTVDAIQAYNVGRSSEEQIAINKGSLRKISKVNAQEVNRWADERSEEIEAYSDAQGHGYRQNVGKDLSVIKWDEKLYGAYKWPTKHFS